MVLRAGLNEKKIKGICWLRIMKENGGNGKEIAETNPTAGGNAIVKWRVRKSVHVCACSSM